MVVGELEHDYVLALDFKGLLEVDYSSRVDEGLAIYFAAREVLQKLFPVLNVLVIDYSLTPQSFEFSLPNCLKVQAV